MAFQRAERKKAKARIGLCGPAGSGKTMGALKLAFGIGGKIALIDTEHGSAELYADLGEYDVDRIEPPYTVEKYIGMMHEAEKAGYDTIIIDSLTHAWAGNGGLLEQKDKTPGNSFAAWRLLTPKHNALVDAILQSPCNIIATMRSKTEYVMQADDRGKQVPVKMGMAPIQREGMDYEFTIVFDIHQDKHVATSSKDRTDLFNGFCEVLSTEHGEKISAWLMQGVDAPPPPPTREQRKDAIKADLQSSSNEEEVIKIEKATMAERKEWPEAWQKGMEKLISGRIAEFQAAAN